MENNNWIYNLIFKNEQKYNKIKVMKLTVIYDNK